MLFFQKRGLCEDAEEHLDHLLAPREANLTKRKLKTFEDDEVTSRDSFLVFWVYE